MKKQRKRKLISDNQLLNDVAHSAETKSMEYIRLLARYALIYTMQRKHEPFDEEVMELAKNVYFGNNNSEETKKILEDFLIKRKEVITRRFVRESFRNYDKTYSMKLATDHVNEMIYKEKEGMSFTQVEVSSHIPGIRVIFNKVNFIKRNEEDETLDSIDQIMIRGHLERISIKNEDIVKLKEIIIEKTTC